MSMHDDDQAMAANLVMGLLDADEQAAAERRLTEDAAFADAVSAWRERLADLDATADPVAPGSGLWTRITESIQTTPASVPLRDGQSSARNVTLWDNIRFWRAAGLVGASAAVLFAIVAIGAVVASIQLRGDLVALAQRKPVYVAVLVNDTTRETGAIVNAFADGRVELIPLKSIDVPAGRTLQVWTLWDRTVGPKSIGLTDQARTLQLDLQSLPRTIQDQLFEITLEPEGGSPIGRPTGPILFKGNAARAM
ncbi:MAG: anti-sigma factor [Bradyrhizobium sp.]|uniref:anti-sigma factor n=1 Tax=Bradyrhizobium sp. TaxID=376 RepID=UPI00271FD193|nr:anti-sigma factor [Bradyrhizobium sp.]MDO9560797.1 anti-sigma factor [Bradyrhizobium sp.]MDP3691426.1 anti-sigma factor [Bradyrhizobium sp.]